MKAKKYYPPASWRACLEQFPVSPVKYGHAPSNLTRVALDAGCGVGVTRAFRELEYIVFDQSVGGYINRNVVPDWDEVKRVVYRSPAKDQDVDVITDMKVAAIGERLRSAGYAVTIIKKDKCSGEVTFSIHLK